MNTCVFRSLNLFHIFYFFLAHNFYKPFPHTKNKHRESHFHYKALMFPLVHVYVSHHVFTITEEPSIQT